MQNLNSVLSTFIFSLIWIASLSVDAHSTENLEIQLYHQAQKIMDNYHGNTPELKKVENLLKRINFFTKDSQYYLVGKARLAYKAGYLHSRSYKKESLQESKRYFLKAYTLYPSFFDAYYYGSLPFIMTGDLKTARYLAFRASQIDPDNPKVPLMWGQIALDEKKYDEAERYVRQALESHKDNKEFNDACYLLIHIYKEQKKYRQTRAIHMKLVDMFPDDPWARVNYASFLLYKLSDYDESIQQAKKALDLMNFILGHRVLGEACSAKGEQLLWEQQKYKESIPYFERSTQHIRKNPRAFFGLGVAYLKLGQINQDKDSLLKAKAAFEQTLKFNKNYKGAIEHMAQVKKNLQMISI
ncbi:tetratricopeptide repeat protein [Desulfogranum japonicum]|uniref:tetratricopeptide repeat protein n=1 Tax=Desulfogranum japonicum TaxID=231447 RepID=UPI00040FEACF|nr:tetratricopeptide repeat protein [Desulfogranum japonicum]